MICHNFPFTISDSACIKLEIEIQTDSIISEEHSKAAIKFGVASSHTTDVKKYIIAFMNRLLLHREKIDKKLLEAHLNPIITKLWQEVLSSLEDTDRKLVNIQSGCLIFTLFCPNHHSLQQVQDSRWGIELQGKVDKLMNGLGMLRTNIFLQMKIMGHSLPVSVCLYGFQAGGMHSTGQK